MKKKKLNNLRVNKVAISNLTVHELKGRGGTTDLTKQWYIDDDGNYVCISVFCR